MVLKISRVLKWQILRNSCHLVIFLYERDFCLRVLSFLIRTVNTNGFGKHPSDFKEYWWKVYPFIYTIKTSMLVMKIWDFFPLTQFLWIKDRIITINNYCLVQFHWRTLFSCLHDFETFISSENKKYYIEQWLLTITYIRFFCEILTESIKDRSFRIVLKEKECQVKSIIKILVIQMYIWLSDQF
jgi:hypothetical protein